MTLRDLGKIAVILDAYSLFNEIDAESRMAVYLIDRFGYSYKFKRASELDFDKLEKKGWRIVAPW